MQRKPLIAAVLAAAFAFPLTSAANNQAAGTKPSANASASTTAGNDGGAEAMFKSMDKNGDGFISKEEAAGTPHAGDFASLDKNGDGKLSREEHANAKEHVAGRSGAKSTASTANSSADTSTTGTKKTY